MALLRYDYLGFMFPSYTVDATVQCWMPGQDYIRSGSLKSLSYRDGQLSSLPGGDTVEQLEVTFCSRRSA